MKRVIINKSKPIYVTVTDQLNCIAQTGRPQPNMSTTFMGRSRPLEDLWRQIPRSAEPVYHHSIQINGRLLLMSQMLLFFFQVINVLSTMPLNSFLPQQSYYRTKYNYNLQNCNWKLELLWKPFNQKMAHFHRFHKSAMLQIKILQFFFGNFYFYYETIALKSVNSTYIQMNGHVIDLL